MMARISILSAVIAPGLLSAAPRHSTFAGLWYLNRTPLEKLLGQSL